MLNFTIGGFVLSPSPSWGAGVVDSGLLFSYLSVKEEKMNTCPHDLVYHSDVCRVGYMRCHRCGDELPVSEVVESLAKRIRLLEKAKETNETV